jgi:hypothetical protein
MRKSSEPIRYAIINVFFMVVKTRRHDVGSFISNDERHCFTVSVTLSLLSLSSFSLSQEFRGYFVSIQIMRICFVLFPFTYHGVLNHNGINVGLERGHNQVERVA